MMKPCKSGCDGALQRCAMLASSPTFMVCLGRCASRALHCIRLADFFKASSKYLLALLAIIVLYPAQAETNAPRLDIGKGGECVRDTQWMRKNHMQLLRHQRVETVRKGVRIEKDGLKNCVECHASKTDNSVLAREDSFCVGCHRYAAVSIDCFECHSSKRKAALAMKDGQ